MNKFIVEISTTDKTIVDYCNKYWARKDDKFQYQHNVSDLAKLFGMKMTEFVTIVKNNCITYFEHEICKNCNKPINPFYTRSEVRRLRYRITISNAGEGTTTIKKPVRLCPVCLKAENEEKERKVKEEIQNIEEQTFNGEKDTLTENIVKAVLEIDNASRGETMKISTSIKSLDSIIGGLQRSRMITIGSRPGVGKTSFALNIFLHNTISQKLPMAFITGECGREKLLQKCISILAKISFDDMMRGKLSNECWVRLVDATKKIKEAPIYLYSKPLTYNYLVEKIIELKTKGIENIFIDYLQLITIDIRNRRFNSKYEELAFLSKEFKHITRKYKIRLILLSQLSRMVDYRYNNKPFLSDLRDSGTIEEDSDLVILLHRDLLKGENEIHFIVKKYRYGRTGEAMAFFNPESMLLSNIETTF